MDDASERAIEEDMLDQFNYFDDEDEELIDRREPASLDSFDLVDEEPEYHSKIMHLSFCKTCQSCDNLVRELQAFLLPQPAWCYFCQGRNCQLGRGAVNKKA